MAKKGKGKQRVDKRTGVQAGKASKPVVEKKKLKQYDFEDDFEDDSNDDVPESQSARQKFTFDDSEDSANGSQAVKVNNRKSKAKAAPRNAFSMLDEDEEDDTDSDDAPPAKQKSAQRRPPTTMFAFDDDEDSQSSELSDAEDVSDKEDAAVESPRAKTPEIPVQEQQRKGKAKKNKKKKKAVQDSSKPDEPPKEKAFDIESVLNDLESAPVEKKLSKAQLKRLRKKQKAQQDSVANDTEADAQKVPEIDPEENKAVDDETEPVEAETSKKKKRRKKKGKAADQAEIKKKQQTNALAKRLQEEKRKREEAERLALEAEQERLRKEQEEIERLEREEAEKEARILARKQAKKDRRDKARQDGTYETTAERKKRLQAARAREMFERSGQFNQEKSDSRKPIVKKKGKGKVFGARKISSKQAQMVQQLEQQQPRPEDPSVDAKSVDDEPSASPQVAVPEPAAVTAVDAVTTPVSEEKTVPKPSPKLSDQPVVSDGDSDEDWDNSDSDTSKPSKSRSKKSSTVAASGGAGSWDGEDDDSSSESEAEANAWADEDAAPTVKPDVKSWKPKSQQPKNLAKNSPKAAGKKSPKAAAKTLKNDESSSGKGKKNQDRKNHQSKAALRDNAKNSKRHKELRAPVCCVLGHVDTGKTKLLDKIRSSSVQEHEVGGITQQIGATFFPMEAIKAQTAELNALQKRQLKYKLPGLLIIDTPGHESFSNLRKRGSTLCDIAIVVIDIMHGIEPQTRESISLLDAQDAPFIVALNKIDRIYEWKPIPNAPFITTLEQQGPSQKAEFEQRVKHVILQLNELGKNCALYYENKDFKDTVSLCPTSAHTGEGIADMLMLLVQLTQHTMADQLQYLSGTAEATVLEVKVSEGLGYTIDVILSNGFLRVGDTIILCGMNGPIATTIRALLVPAPMTEIRVKSEYLRLQEVKASMGIRISAPGLQDTIAGSQLLVCGPRDDKEALMDSVMGDLADVLSRVDRSGRGVYVQSSTLGALEALLQFLSDEKIPVSGIALGPVHKLDVTKASVMLEFQREYAVILAFNVKVDHEAQLLADRLGVKIFTKEIIYNLTDTFKEYLTQVYDERRLNAHEAVFPVLLDILPEHIFHNHKPIILGCEIKQGLLKLGTPLCAMFDKVEDDAKQYVEIGRIESLEVDSVPKKFAKAGEKVAVKIAQGVMESHIYYGRQFDYRNKLCSVLTRNSIDVLKEHFKQELSDENWRLVVKLKKFFQII
uniref:Eukaryotic translation initiation factor 5B n=1 Tax=Hirondellea gigas TaxID=1518452 RepID=A0A6A7FX50_9CRUS